MATTSIVATNKAELRRLILSRVSNQMKERQIQSRLILEKLLKHPQYDQAKQISVFISTANEVDTLPILEYSLERKKRCFIPYINDRQTFETIKRPRMVMVEFKSMAEYAQMSLNKWGIREPNADFLKNRQRADPELGNLDLIIVPGVAFSTDGRRLGKGKGYYDEFLFHWSKVSPNPLYSIGLAFKEQIVDDPFAEKGKDYVLDFILTAQ